jgi:hypothetical protein
MTTEQIQAPKKTVWNIRVTRPSPSMDQDRIVFEAAGYTEAVKFAQQAWLKLELKRPVTLSGREYGMDNWYRIDASGVAINRAINTDIPATALIQEVPASAPAPRGMRCVSCGGTEMNYLSECVICAKETV